MKRRTRGRPALQDVVDGRMRLEESAERRGRMIAGGQKCVSMERGTEGMIILEGALDVMEMVGPFRREVRYRRSVCMAVFKMVRFGGIGGEWRLWANGRARDRGTDSQLVACVGCLTCIVEDSAVATGLEWRLSRRGRL